MLQKVNESCFELNETVVLPQVPKDNEEFYSWKHLKNRTIERLQLQNLKSHLVDLKALLRELGYADGWMVKHKTARYYAGDYTNDLKFSSKEEKQQFLKLLDVDSYEETLGGMKR